jgi:peptidoglycan/LPS O-acetylase OafA/YrhL
MRTASVTGLTTSGAAAVEVPQAPQPAAAAAHRRDIQGLRAVAVLLVALGHAGVPFLPGGFVGVDVFFVLSGFLITGLLLAEARSHGSVSLLDFYVRRARRILPAAALTLLATNVAAFYALNFVRAQQAVDDGLHAGAFAANFHFAARGVDYFAQGEPPSPVLHYWSLSVEEQFYFVWPLLLSVSLFGLAVHRRRKASKRCERRLLAVMLLLALASLAYSIRLTATAPTDAYFSPFTRAWELGLGATIAVCASTLARIPQPWKVAMGWVGLAAIGIAAVVFSEQTPFPGFAGILPTVGTGLALVAGIGAGESRLSAARLLSLRPMFMIGDRSYAFYLWHWPVLILAAAYVGHDLSVPAKLGLVTGAFALSCISYALVENPIRHRVRSRRTTAVVVAICMAAFLGSSAVSLAGIDREARRSAAASTADPVALLTDGGAGTSSAKGALPAVIAAVAAVRRDAPIPTHLAPPLAKLGGVPHEYALPDACIGHDVSKRIATSVCRTGDISSTKVIVLLGDSHAWMWLPAIVEMARRDHLAVVPLLRLGCTPVRWMGRERDAGCDAWYRWAVQQVGTLRPALILVTGSLSKKPSASERAGVANLTSAARTLRRLGKVVVIGDPEGLERAPVDCLLSRHASMAACATTWPSQRFEVGDEVARQARAVGAGFLATRPLLCYERTCPAVIGRTIAWADDNHVSGTYSAWVAPAFRAALLRAAASASSAGS